MEIADSWAVSRDGSVRPVVTARIVRSDGTLFEETFLIDSGADATVLSAAAYHHSGLTASAAGGPTLEGVGGAVDSVAVAATLVFRTTDGIDLRVNSVVNAFTDSLASDINILGRYVLNLFELIVSRRKDQVLLLCQRHGYAVQYT